MKRTLIVMATAAFGQIGLAAADHNTSAPQDLLGSASAHAQTQAHGQHAAHTCNSTCHHHNTAQHRTISRRVVPTRQAKPTPPRATTSTPVGTGFPEAEIGECYARVMIPAVYDSVPQTVTTQDAYDSIQVTEASLAPDTLTVKTRDAGMRYIVRQPRYEARTEDVLVAPAHERLIVVPAQFETVTERVQVRGPRKVWKPGENLSAIKRTDPNTGIVYCLVEEPAEYETVTRRVLIAPEQVRTETVPAEYKTITKQVLVDAGGVDEQPIPAEFEEVAVTRLANAASQSTRPVAAQTSTLNTSVLRTGERYEWAPVLCETNATPASISRVQQALANAGVYSGEVDGIAGPQTEAALKRFQSANGLPGNGLITQKTAEALGMSDLVSGARQNASTTPIAGAPASPAPTAQSTTGTYQPAPQVAERAARSRTGNRLTWAGKTPG